MVEKFLKIKEINEKAVVKVNDNSLQEVEAKIEMKYEFDKSLKELKEMAIVLRQKLDTLESEKNMMEVEYSQVNLKDNLTTMF